MCIWVHRGGEEVFLEELPVRSGSGTGTGSLGLGNRERVQSAGALLLLESHSFPWSSEILFKCIPLGWPLPQRSWNWGLTKTCLDSPTSPWHFTG